MATLLTADTRLELTVEQIDDDGSVTEQVIIPSLEGGGGNRISTGRLQFDQDI